MGVENIYIEIDKEEATDLYKDLVNLEVVLEEDKAGRFSLMVPIYLKSDGKWAYLDDEKYSVWKPIAIKAGFEGSLEELITGYITRITPCFQPDPSQCVLEIRGMDKSVLLSLEEKIKTWPNKKDSDIAREILDKYKEFNLTPVVEETSVPYKESIATITQRESDINFLRRLARRNNFECYLEGDTVYFCEPRMEGESQGILSCQFGGETNVECFSFEVNALAPTQVAMTQVDRVKKDVMEIPEVTGMQKALGAIDANGFSTDGIPPAKIYLDMPPQVECSQGEKGCRRAYQKGQCFLTAEGTIDGNRFGHVLKARKIVTVKGVGANYSGEYYVTQVTHSFTPEGYIQHFKVKRNALKVTGSEDFSGPGEE